MIKDLLRIGSQFIGYREYANRAEEKLAEANERADALARKLEQSEAARKKADLAASKAKAEADEAKAKAAGVEELQKKLEDATAALDEHKAAQASREEGILKRLKTQSRRTFTQTNQDFDLTNPVNDPVLDALSYLELHGSEIREGVSNASAVLLVMEKEERLNLQHSERVMIKAYVERGLSMPPSKFFTERSNIYSRQKHRNTTSGTDGEETWKKTSSELLHRALEDKASFPSSSTALEMH
nr:uncharacterized protein LOC127303584 [Lolium perenne]